MDEVGYCRLPCCYSVLQQVMAGYRVITVGYSRLPMVEVGYSRLPKVEVG